VIDDEPAARRLMKNLLQEYSDVVEVIGEASNGKEAIEKIEKLRPGSYLSRHTNARPDRV
jgi:two-component system LytT family response regulator